MIRQLSKHCAQLERTTWRVLTAGLLARLLVMPFAAHCDLMHVYWKAHLVVYHRQPVVGFQALLRLFHAAYLRALAPLLPRADSLWFHRADDPLTSPFLAGQAVPIQGWFGFVSHPQVYRTLFLLKFPYLLFDLACVFLLSHLGSDRSKSRWRLIFWWLNPILLFATYVFGRYEVIALFFILLSLYLIERGRRTWGLLALGVAIALRYYAIFLLPFYVLSLETGWRARIQGVIAGLAPWLLVNVLTWVLGGVPESIGLINLPHRDYLLSMKLRVADWDNLYIFPLVYCLLVLHKLYNRELGLRSLQRYGLVALLLLFATAYTGQSPQYWTWFLPFLAIGAAEDRRLLPLHAAQVLCLVVYSFIGGRATAGYLFASIAPGFFWSLPSPVEVLGHFASPEMVISLARTAFSAITLWMAYLVFRRIKTDKVVNYD